jgi:hypothetical protein
VEFENVTLRNGGKIVEFTKLAILLYSLLSILIFPENTIKSGHSPSKTNYQFIANKHTLHLFPKIYKFFLSFGAKNLFCETWKILSIFLWGNFWLILIAFGSMWVE